MVYLPRIADLEKATKKLGEFLEKLAQPAEYDALDDTWRFIVKRINSHRM